MISDRPLNGKKGSHGGLEETAMKQFVWLPIVPNKLFCEMIKVILHENEIAKLSRRRNKSGWQRILVKIVCIILFPEQNIQVEINIFGFRPRKWGYSHSGWTSRMSSPACGSDGPWRGEGRHLTHETLDETFIRSDATLHCSCCNTFTFILDNWKIIMACLSWPFDWCE